MKGDAKLTTKLKNAHTRYMTDFGDDSPKDPKGSPFQWKEWLNYNGYDLDSGGHVYPMDDEQVSKREHDMKGL